MEDEEDSELDDDEEEDDEDEELSLRVSVRVLDDEDDEEEEVSRFLRPTPDRAAFLAALPVFCPAWLAPSPAALPALPAF